MTKAQEAEVLRVLAGMVGWLSHLWADAPGSYDELAYFDEGSRHDIHKLHERGEAVLDEILDSGCLRSDDPDPSEGACGD